ncbi:hypothetical protein ACVGW2_08620, partial [Enterobacter intestinihominis]
PVTVNTTRQQLPTNRRNPFAYCKGVFPCSPAPPPPGVKTPTKKYLKKPTKKIKKNSSQKKKH